MKMRKWAICLLMTTLALNVCSVPAIAGKPSKGGGGGGGDDGSSDPPVLPPFNYEVSVVPVEGLIQLHVVNDYGVCGVRVRPSQIVTPILTAATGAAAIVDTTFNPPQVIYLDNAIDADEPWDLVSVQGINNQGQILVTGRKNDVILSRVCLLDPRVDDAGYDLIDLGVDGIRTRAVALTESGDVLYTIDDVYMIRLSNGTVLPLPSTDTHYFGLNSLGMLVGGYTLEGTNYSAGENFLSDILGVAMPLTLLPYRTQADLPTLGESGYSFGSQRGPIVKIKGTEFGGYSEVTYDPTGKPTGFNLPFSINFREVNSQVVSEVPLIAGNVGSGGMSSSGIYGKPWIRFPGYDAVVILELMDPVQQSLLQTLKLGSIGQLGESQSDFLLTSPRNQFGEVVHGGAPTLYGDAFRNEREPGQVGHEGIYIISPTMVP